MQRRVCCLAALVFAAAAPLSGQGVALVTDGPIEAPARHGLDRLRESLASHGLAAEKDAGFMALAGLCRGTRAAEALRGAGLPLPEGAEALAVRKVRYQGKPALALCGTDARGLMYAALDTAERIGWARGGKDPFAHVRDTSEKPHLAERGISIYTMQRAYFESRLYDEEHWKSYFDLLARSRINAFTVIFGYENGGFMAPPYPYFFDVPEFPGVRLVGITREQQAKNTAAFRRMIAIAHERGIDVIPAIWDHIYRGGVQGGGIPGASELAGKEVPGLVTGVTTENLASYTKAALRRFLEVFPEVDGLEFRMHAESGLKPAEMAGFWHEVFVDLARVKPGMRVTLRAKELPDEIIDDALKQGLNARIETKYWMEQMGLPFHPTHVNRQNQKERRHGYADLLKYPQRYRVHWRLWNGGTTRLLLWADPEYVRRFAESARLYDGNSFDVNEMLATKMLGEPHESAPLPIHTPEYRFYRYEFERYWHFYQLWGRLSYNPRTPAEVWEREFTRRFGAAGIPLMKGLHEASKVLPRIVAASYRYQLFPTTRGWAEMMRQGDLPEFAGLEGSDTEQFLSPREEALRLLGGPSTSKRRPVVTSSWFMTTSAAISSQVRAAETAGLTGIEAKSVVTDLRILEALANYYSARLSGAVDYQLYRETGDPEAFQRVVSDEGAAVTWWGRLVDAAGEVYSRDLAFGVHRVGFPRHWSEEYGRLKAGMEKLLKDPKLPLKSQAKPNWRYGGDITPPAVDIDRPALARAGRDLLVSARVADPAGLESVRLRYRHLTQWEDYQAVEMVFDEKTKKYVAKIPGAFITPEWDVMFFVEAIDANGNGRNYPDLDREAPYVIVPVSRPGAVRPVTAAPPR